MPLNINVGLLGHVDSGKTSLSKALSKISSTAAFDKNPQSQERGITLDLGFSGLSVDAPESLRDKSSDGTLVFTFVDCPGHQSLIKTIIGGAQIIGEWVIWFLAKSSSSLLSSNILDMTILVVDIQKGFETQTGECLILGEITTKPMIVVLNKIDIIDEKKRDATIEKVTKKVQKTLEPTIFKASKIISVSANSLMNIDQLTDAMVNEVEKINLTRNNQADFIFAFDHCFTIKGSGTVLSGTVMQGSIKINDTIEIPHLKTDRKVKSMQMFRKPVNSGAAGDRLGICITNFDSKQLERGLVCQKGFVQPAFAVIIKLNRIRYYKRDIKTKAKFHCSVGHETVMGNILLFSAAHSDFNWDNEYQHEDMFNDAQDNQRNVFALIEFEHSVMVHEDMLLIGSKLDTEQTNVCRLAFHGKILMKHASSDRNYQQTFLHNLKVFKTKSREGTVQRVVNDYEVITANLFKKETDRSKFIGMKCQLSSGECGTIAGSFGQSSKVRIQLTKPLEASTAGALKNPQNNVKVHLSFKKFIFDKNHRMVQS